MADNATCSKFPEHSAGARQSSGSPPETEILEEGLRILCRNNPDAHELIAPRHEQITALLCAYIAEIETQNPALGLVGTRDRQELIKRHILDSLAPLGIFCRLLKERSQGHKPRIADVGSGAGLPGIPLAIALPHVELFLVERMGRRAAFLRSARETLALPNVTIVEDELEKYAHNLIAREKSGSGRFDLVTFRAFRPFEPKIIKGLFRLCAPCGVIAAYKGKLEKTRAEISELENYLAGPGNKSKITLSRCEIIPCPTPLLEEERHIALMFTQ